MGFMPGLRVKTSDTEHRLLAATGEVGDRSVAHPFDGFGAMKSAGSS